MNSERIPSIEITLSIIVFLASKNGIVLPKLSTVRKNCSSNPERTSKKFKAEGQEFAKFLGSLEQFIQTVKGQKIFW